MPIERSPRATDPRQRLPGRRSPDPSPGDLRLVVALWPLLERRIGALELGRGGRGRARVLPAADQLRWPGLYELPFPRHLAAAAVAFDMDRELIGAARQAIPVASLARLTSVYVKHESHETGPGVSGAIAAESWTRAGYLRSMRESLRALLVFGCSVNELVARARDGGDDRALHDAIRIDPAVLLGATGAARMARALLEGDTRFVRAVNKAMGEGLGSRQSAREATGIAAVEAIATSPWQALDDRRLLALFRGLRRTAAGAGVAGKARARLGRLAIDRVRAGGRPRGSA